MRVQRFCLNAWPEIYYFLVSPQIFGLHQILRHISRSEFCPIVKEMTSFEIMLTL